MPKVTQEYRDARREQILDAARRCFLRSGFDGTSMQDLFAEAELSSGAVYRYFDSKADIMAAIAEQNMFAVLDLIRELAAQPRGQGMGAALAEVLTVVERKHRDSNIGPMAVLVWAELQRSRSLAQRFEHTVAQLRAELAEVVRGYQSDGSLPGDASPDAMAKLLISIIPGFILQLSVFGAEDLSDVAAAAATLWPRPA